MLDLGAALIDFAAYHRTRGNRVCHYLGLPAIAAAALGALAQVELMGSGVDLGMVLLVVTLLFDLWLNGRIAVAVFLLGAALYAATAALPWAALGGLFAFGWVCQLVGHRVFERNAPAFTDNARHLLVGPRWLANRLVRALPDEPPPRAREGGDARAE